MNIKQIWVVYAYDRNNIEYAIAGFDWYKDAKDYAESLQTMTTRIGTLNLFEREKGI